MNIEEFNECMEAITHVSLQGGKSHCKNLDNGRVLQNCVALVNAYAYLLTGKELYTGDPCKFPINTHTPTKGCIAIWQDHVAIVYDPKSYTCLSSARNGYFYKKMIYKNWSRSGGKLLGFYTFDKATKTKYTDDYIKTIARGIVQGTYGNGDSRIKKLKSLGLTDKQITDAQNLVNDFYKNGGKW